MKKALKNIKAKLYHYVDDNRVEGANQNMTGNCPDLFGDCTGLYGDCTGLYGNCTGLYGNCTGVCGDCTVLYGNLDACELTEKDRKSVILIRDLIGERE